MGVDKTVSIPHDIACFKEMALLDALLLDRTTGSNIIWATNAYEHLGVGFAPKDEITSAGVTDKHANNIRRRARKDKEEQTALTRTHAEVFTPAWIVKMMVDAADAEWRESLQLQGGEEEWQAYVSSPRLEITCGEAPYLVNRYDASDGSVTPLSERTGILSRKLALVNTNAKTREMWVGWAKTAVQSVYGYEFQGDNLLIARVNMLCTVEDYLAATKFDGLAPEEYAEFADIISWNLWQMDGLTKCVPFGIPAKEKAQATLFDFMDGAAEEEQVREDCVIYDWKRDKQIEFASIRKGSDMKFDYIIGNPPYQEETEGTSDNPIYDRFMDGAYEVSDKVELITPARFLFNAGKTPKAWNNKMLNDTHLKVVHYEQISSNIFPNTDIKGGVVITYRDVTVELDPIGTFTHFDELNSIMQKVKSKSFEPFNELIYAPESYRISKLFHEENPTAFTKLSNGHMYDLTTNILEKLSDYFSEEPIDDNYIGIYGRIEGQRTKKWIKRSYLDPHPNLDYFKVILPKSNGSGALGEVLSTPLIGAPLIGAPLIGHTQTFISIGRFETEEEAQACLKYIKSKFARTLLGILKVTQDNKKATWAMVPLQDFTSSSDIDWSQSVAEIDVQLYKKYGLSNDEIEFIETHVKAMD